ncbi:benzoate/H(+) symporter BenE family transporter [Alteromonas sp. a30]|nr:benzoate/H(+) symporter BenE family transporter [Alteromonas sp. a30]
MQGRLNLSHITAGFTAVLVGYTSAVVIIIQVATNAGATPEQIESWLLALGVAMGSTSILFSWFYKTPILIAWSTPGAAMLVAAVEQYSLSTAIGAFIMTGALIALTGLITPLSRALERIPSQLGTAMLGAVLVPFCMNAFVPAQEQLWIFLAMFISFLVAKFVIPRFAMLVLLIVGVLGAYINGEIATNAINLSVAMPVWMSPKFDLLALINLTLPLYVITMLSQNLPGITMIKTHGYQPPVKSVLVGTGVANMLFAPFGGYSLNLAAITAAICMNDAVDGDRSKRYRAAIWAGVFYLIAGLFATTVVALFLALPKYVSQILAGLALLGTLLMCLQTAFKTPKYQEPALFTFLITLSGVSIFGVSATLLGLLVGLVYLRFVKV